MFLILSIVTMILDEHRSLHDHRSNLLTISYLHITLMSRNIYNQIIAGV